MRELINALKPKALRERLLIPRIRGSREVAVNFLPVKASHKGDCTLLENKAQAIIADTNAVVFALGLQLFEVGNLLECSGRLHLFNHTLNPPTQSGIGEGGQASAKDSRKRVFTPSAGVAGRFSCGW